MAPNSKWPGPDSVAVETRVCVCVSPQGRNITSSPVVGILSHIGSRRFSEMAINIDIVPGACNPLFHCIIKFEPFCYERLHIQTPHKIMGTICTHVGGTKEIVAPLSRSS